MQPVRKIAVAGATGRLGHHVVDVLRAQGHDVVPISRSSEVDVITGRSRHPANRAGLDHRSRPVHWWLLCGEVGAGADDAGGAGPGPNPAGDAVP